MEQAHSNFVESYTVDDMLKIGTNSQCSVLWMTEFSDVILWRITTQRWYSKHLHPSQH